MGEVMVTIELLSDRRVLAAGELGCTAGYGDMHGWLDAQSGVLERRACPVAPSVVGLFTARDI